MATRACWGCDPRTTLPNGVDVSSSEGDLRLLDSRSEKLGLLNSSNLIEVCDAALDDDQAADKSAKHGGVKHRNRGRVRDVTNEESLPGRRGHRITNKQDYHEGGNACQEDKGHPEKPLDTAEGHRLS